ncbi:MAG: hypothetical protein ACKPKO_60175, partial [Candidatus Fonsibacter sp.]
HNLFSNHLNNNLNLNVEQCQGQGRGDSRVRFYKSPAYPRLALTNKDRNPVLSVPQLLTNQDVLPTQLWTTTSSSENRQGP